MVSHSDVDLLAEMKQNQAERLTLLDRTPPANPVHEPFLQAVHEEKCKTES